MLINPNIFIQSYTEPPGPIDNSAFLEKKGNTHVIIEGKIVFQIISTACEFIYL